MRKAEVKVGERGQIVIPKELRKRQGIKPGTLLKVIGLNHYILLKKVKVETFEEKFLKLIKKLNLEEKEAQKIWIEIQKEREEER